MHTTKSIKEKKSYYIGPGRKYMLRHTIKVQKNMS
jgi:hypothetical protein